MSGEPTCYEWIRNAIHQPDKRISRTCNPNINQSPPVGPQGGGGGGGGGEIRRYTEEATQRLNHKLENVTGWNANVYRFISNYIR